MKKIFSTKNIIVKSNLPSADYVINPYVGCLHNCEYCYAVFMKRFYHIEEEWGKFAYAKDFPRINNPSKYNGKKVLLSSVTDPYQQLEKKMKVTREIVKQFINTDVLLEVLTKSDLVVRDIDIFKQIPNMLVGMSMSLTLPEFSKKIERGCPIYDKRLDALKKLSKEGISTYVFISPIFPFLTDYKKIISDVKEYVDYIYIENLNLRGKYKGKILDIISKEKPEYYEEYIKIYSDKDYNKLYWEGIKNDIREYCENTNCLDKLKIFFYHGKQ